MSKKVYLLKEEGTSTYKIGVAINPHQRLKNIQTGNSEKVILVETFETEYAGRVEKALHNIYSHKRKNGEWFDLSLEDEMNFKAFCAKINNNLQYLDKNRI